MLGGADVTLPEGDYWIVIREVGQTPDKLPFEEGSYTYRILVQNEDGTQSVEEQTSAWKPLSFHITSHDTMVESNPSTTTNPDGSEASTGISVDLSGVAQAEKQKVYAEDGQPVRLVKYEGPVSGDGTNPDGQTVITIAGKTYVKSASGKFVKCTDEGRYVEVTVYDSKKPSMVNAELTLNRIEHNSTISVTLNAEGADPNAPGAVTIVSMTEVKTSEPVVDEEGNPVLDEEGNPTYEERTTYVEGDPVEGYVNVPVAANGEVEVATLPRGHYGLKVTGSPSMPAELGGGLGYKLPSGVEHFFVVGLGDPISFDYTLEHVWDASPITFTMTAYGADTPGYVVLYNENGDPIDPATGSPVVAEEGETVDASAYKIAVTKDQKI